MTAPLASAHGAQLDGLLSIASELGFVVPREAAVHVHFDAGPLRSAMAVRNLVRLWRRWGATLKALVGTNPACRQLGAWSEELHRCVDAPGFVDLPWDEARARLAGVGLRKFCDLNLLGLVAAEPVHETVEVRVLPGAIDTAKILLGAALLEGLPRRCLADEPVPAEAPRRVRPRHTRALLEALPLDPAVRAYWLGRGG